MILGQRNSTEKRWSKDVIRSLTDVFVDDFKAVTYDKFDEFVTKLKRSLFSFGKQYLHLPNIQQVESLMNISKSTARSSDWLCCNSIPSDIMLREFNG